MHTTALKIIKELVKNHLLTAVEKDFINSAVFEATREAYNEGKTYEVNDNGCNCYQPNCGVCN